MANVTKNDLHALYLKILPYLAPQSGGGGGHKIEDNTGTDLTDRDTLQFGGDLEASDDSTNEKTVVEPHELTNAEIADIFAQIPIVPASTYVPNTGFTPVGTVISVMGNHAPTHYLVCDGTEYYISEYPVLANYFETEFGEKNYFGGNGTTTFAVPDLQGEFLRGAGTNSHENQGSGGDVGDHQNATSIPDFKYVTASNRMTHFTKSVVTDEQVRPQNFDYLSSDSGSLDAHNITTTKVTSSNDAIYGTVRPTNTSVLYCIAVQNIYIDAACNYSLDEVVVGTWLDGKPVYQKVLKFDFTSYSDSFTGALNISDLETLVKAEVYHVYTNGASIESARYGTASYFFSWYISGGNVLVTNKINNISNYSYVVHLQYTKTTD